MERCSGHGELFGMVQRIDERTLNIDKRINGSIDDIQKHIERGQSWRIAIVGVAIMVIIQIIGFAYMYGCLNQKVIYLEGNAYASEAK